MNNTKRVIPIIAFGSSLGLICLRYLIQKQNRNKDLLFYYNKSLKSHLDQMNNIKAITIPNVNINCIHKDNLNDSPIMTLINNSVIKSIKVNKRQPSFFSKYNFYSKIDCFFNVKTVNDLITLREEFRWLENLQNRIILLSKGSYDKIDKKTLLKYCNTKTKIITVSNLELTKYLGIESNDCFYIYYPPKLPFTLSTPEFVDKSLYPFFHLNPLFLLLKHKLFRDEMVIENNEVYIKHKGVVKYAETFHYKIKENLTKRGTHLFIYLPQWEDLNEEAMTQTLRDYYPMFDSVNITTSLSLAKKFGLYQHNTLLTSIPQIFALHNTSNGKVIKYNLTYFHFKKNYDLLYKGNLPEYISQTKIKSKSTVIQVNSESFRDRVIRDNSFKEFIIEISKENCPSCSILGKMFDHLSLKLSKHKVDKLKLFRIDCNNDIPYIGEFDATPTFVFCRKNNMGQIEYMCQLNKDNFISKLKEVSELDLSKIHYNKNIANGYLLFLDRYFEKENFDPDIDLL